MLSLKYCSGALFLSLLYFSTLYSATNEVLYGVLRRRYGYENFYVNHSTSALACIPLFAAAQGST